MNKRYSDAQLMWLKTQGYSKVWKNRQAFLDEFNKTFGTEIGVYTFNNLVLYYGIKICTQQTESIFTDDQKKWLVDNALSGNFKNCKHLTDTYNALFSECRDHNNIYGYLHSWGITLNSKYKDNRYSEEMDGWICENYLSFETADDATEEFNKTFKTNKSTAAIMHRAKRLGIKRKSKRFRKGEKCNSKKIGDISDRTDYKWIKVNNNSDKTSWIPLHKYVWEQAHGKVPDGCCVVFVSDNHNDVSLSNLALIDRRGTAIMAKFGWFTENRTITQTGIEWCNLYLTAKDNGIYA